LEYEVDLGSLELDLRKTKQIIYNLLANAVKFSEHGSSVIFAVREVGHDAVGQIPGDWPAHGFALQPSAHEHFLELSVSDTGIGIAEDDMSKLFKAFSQIDSSLARKFEGTGLGLAMVKQLTDLHGGSVAVASRVGEGTRFVVWLPLLRAKEAAWPKS
ncbi:MAG: ATP-binding protein, partial [Pseudomonas sp.]|uniref:ATP-binding protein n=1 Tax=Pseudomonas sp. TaxID=306 RepID=UPI003C7435DC